MMELLCNINVLRWWFCFFFLFHATLLMSPSASMESIEPKGLANVTDALALLAFKQQIERDPFGALSSWNNSLPFCQWPGITCSQGHLQRVVAMDLKGLELVGPLSPFIANLTFLRRIDLRENKLHGQIPSEFGRLFRLRSLNLSHNLLGGEIPANLTRCWRLKSVDVGRNELKGRIPVELGSLSKLRILNLYHNKLTGSIPASLGNLSSLARLSLAINGLEGHIPKELGQIGSLSFFQVQENKLSGSIPPTLYNLSFLTIFSATSNQLHGTLPVNLGATLPNLVEFHVAENRFTGPIPVALSNSTRLEKLEFGSNQFTGSIPMNLGRLGALQYLSLEVNSLGTGEKEDMSSLSSLTNCSLLNFLSVSSNQLIGALPSSIANLSNNLQQLYLGGNQLFGSIPSRIGNLHNLIAFGIEINNMTGTIPEGIGKLSKLQVLHLNKNKFLGEFPYFISNNTQLFKLHLEENHLKGSIPSTLEKCHRLSQLHLASNNLNGYIPKQVFNIATLRYLNIEANSLVGSLPAEVGNLKNLEELYVSDNKLSGEIPSSLGNCVTLAKLHIRNNYFEGTLPPLSCLKGMLEMDISRNNFTGQIPEYLEKLPNLQYLNLSYNDFEGKVPQEGIFKNTSAISVTGNRKLCGGHPALLLPKCSSQDDKKQRKLSPRAIIAIFIGSVVCLSLLLFLLYYYIRKSKKLPSLHPLTYPLEEQFLDISYGDLCKATDGFSSTNLIGVGSYGSVYKGFLECIKKFVAVKVLNLQRRGASKSFIVECKALRNVRHRNLLKVLTVCSSIDFKGDDFKALVFKYMANGNLEQWLHSNIEEQHQSKNLSLVQRLNIAVDVASALNYLHNSCKKPIVHCDLKPSNVLLDDDMNAHIGDFGIARFLYEITGSCSQKNNSSSGIRGTIGYVAPEYGMGCQASTFGDVYSYGILLLEMFTGKKPTDQMFDESVNLHQFAKLALPERVMEIVDQSLLSMGAESDVNESQSHADAKRRLEICLISTIKVGVACSLISIEDRMEIKDAMVEMHGIRNVYLGVGIQDRGS